MSFCPRMWQKMTSIIFNRFTNDWNRRQSSITLDEHGQFLELVMALPLNGKNGTRRISNHTDAFVSPANVSPQDV